MKGSTAGIEKRYISKVELSEYFPDASEEYGFDHFIMDAKDLFAADTDSLFEKIVKLRMRWLEHNQVEIYKDDSDRAWGRVKATDSSVGAPGLGYYAGFFHGRLKPWKNDPLIVISFRTPVTPIPEGYDSAYDLVVIHAISDHEALFGTEQEKHDREAMRRKRTKNSAILDFDAGSVGFPFLPDSE